MATTAFITAGIPVAKNDESTTGTTAFITAGISAEPAKPTITGDIAQSSELPTQSATGTVTAVPRNKRLAFNPFTGTFDFVQNLKAYLPYHGATRALNLGAENLSTTGTITGNLTGNVVATTVDTGTLTLDDNEKIKLGTGEDTELYYDGTNLKLVTDIVAASDFVLDCGTAKTLELSEVVYDDIRITAGSFDRPGTSDPTIRTVTPGGGAVSTFLYEFAKTNLASFQVQLPHTYKPGANIYVHVHWTPADRGVAEDGATVGWKIDYTWASINGTFAEMAELDLSDACDGVDWKHQMTPDILIAGDSKGISSMLICNVKRTDTGADDTWASAANGQQPKLLEIDFHYPVNTMGSREKAAK